MVGAAVAGMFVTLVAGSEVYGVLSPLAAVGGSMMVGALATALATALAIRWAGRAVAVIGLLGALLSPILVGATLDATTVAIVAIGDACAMAAMVARRWNWLGVAAVVACAGLWGAWMLAGQSALADLVVLAWFGGIGLAGAIGMQVRSVDDALRPSAAALVPLNICIVGVLGEVALRHAVGGHAGAARLAALALVHGAAGATRVRRIAVSESFRRLLLVFAVVLADVAFGLTAGGVVLVAGWGAAAIGFAWCGRRTALEGDQALVRLGLGAHISLTLIRVLLSAPPRDLGSAQLVPLLSVVILVGSCLASGFLVGSRDRRLAMVLNAAGLTAVAYLTAQTLSGSALVTAWAFEALALSRLAATGRDGVARFGAVGFLALAATHALVIEAPPMALVDGARSLGAAAIALGAIAIAVSLAAVGSDRDARPWLLGGAAAALLYLGSVAIITVFQPAAGVAPDLLELSVRQQGQVLLSACWSLVGVVSLIAGLRRNQAPVRNAALGLLLLTVAKVFLYDLSALTSLYRVVSFIALGLLLLVGAFAYQRLRPPPLPDMRSVHRSQR